MIGFHIASTSCSLYISTYIWIVARDSSENSIPFVKIEKSFIQSRYYKHYKIRSQAKAGICRIIFSYVDKLVLRVLVFQYAQLFY